jgi:preprotein translocase subunit SecD
MIEFNDDLIKNQRLFDSVLSKIRASGVTDEDEATEILMREHRYLFRELTDEEKELAIQAAETSLVENAMADLNRESIKEKGHPFVVCQRIDGVKHFKRYDVLTAQEIAELQASGVIL